MSIKSYRYPKHVRNSMGTTIDINFYLRVWMLVNIGCGLIFAISDPNSTCCHPLVHLLLVECMHIQNCV